MGDSASDPDTSGCMDTDQSSRSGLAGVPRGAVSDHVWDARRCVLIRVRKKSTLVAIACVHSFIKEA